MVTSLALKSQRFGNKRRLNFIKSINMEDVPLTLEEEECLLKHRACVVVPAAGEGSRMRSDVPKQYAEVCGSPLVLHCLRALSRPPWVDRIALVVNDVERARRILAREKLPKVFVVKGLNTRHRSILAGLKAFETHRPELVLIHDGCRPIVPRGILEQVALKALEAGACGVVRPLVSTVVRPGPSNYLESTLERSLYRNSEMPQGFRFHVILEAYKECSDDDLDYATECLALALKYKGIRAHLIEGTADLWKVTHPHDLTIARFLLPKHVLNVKIWTPQCSDQNCVASSTVRRNRDAFSTLCEVSTNALMPLKDFMDALHDVESSVQEGSCCKKKNELNKADVCSRSVSTIARISPTVMKCSASAQIVVTAPPRINHEACTCLIIVTCVASVAEAQMIISTAKESVQTSRSSFIFVLNKRFGGERDEEFVSLRAFLFAHFPDNEAFVVVIICNSLPISDQNEEDELDSLMKQILSSPSSKAFHNQILFVGNCERRHLEP